MPHASVLTSGIEKELSQGSFRLAGMLFRLVKPIVRSFLSQLLARRILLATIMEDLPYKENLVTLSRKTDEHGRRRLVLQYKIREHDRSRINAFRQEMVNALNPYRFMLIKQAEKNERIAHACGTCRFGLDPERNVLDANNRAHGIANLYVADGSFFPSSGGTNPSLTIAANALRVAEHLLKL